MGARAQLPFNHVVHRRTDVVRLPKMAAVCCDRFDGYFSSGAGIRIDRLRGSQHRRCGNNSFHVLWDRFRRLHSFDDLQNGIRRGQDFHPLPSVEGLICDQNHPRMLPLERILVGDFFGQTELLAQLRGQAS